jgi:queuine tRNA-ribosyltransferase
VTCAVPYTVEAIDRGTNARAGKLELARGTIHTPVFMPVGTQAALRSLPPLFVDQLGIEIILANTYHLHQRPGEGTIQKLGGLHKFMNVKVPILTDSGGFQVFSLSKKEISEEGVAFAYELDGKKTFLSPETSMAIQSDLASDIAMAFDECLPADAERNRTEISVDMTARWAERCIAAHTNPEQSLFGIVQGGMHEDLRRRSVEQITNLPFDGYAIGGLSVGEGPDEMNRVLAATMPHMPAAAPRYLMGVGRPQDLVDGIAVGVDMFDCVIPTRHARSGTTYTFQGRLRVTHSRFRRDAYPLDTSCKCYTCSNFSRAYLHHLFSVGEVLGATLCTVHNLAFYKQLMDRARAAICAGRFTAFRRDIKDLYPETTERKAEDSDHRKKAAGSRQADGNVKGQSVRPSKSSGSRSPGSKPSGSKPSGSKPSGSKPSGSKPSGSKPSGGTGRRGSSRGRS